MRSLHVAALVPAPAVRPTPTDTHGKGMPHWKAGAACLPAVLVLATLGTNHRPYLLK
jgi:hypothetical protein